MSCNRKKLQYKKESIYTSEKKKSIWTSLQDDKIQSRERLSINFIKKSSDVIDKNYWVWTHFLW